MSEAPRLIWLQRPNNDSMSEWCGEVTWCEDKQNDDDTCYIKAGQKTIDITRELTDLRERLEKAEKDAKRLEALLVMDAVKAQALFWNCSNRKSRLETIDAAIAKERTA